MKWYLLGAMTAMFLLTGCWPYPGPRAGMVPGLRLAPRSIVFEMRAGDAGDER